MNEYKRKIRGSQLKQIDDYDKMAREAMAHAYAQNAGKKARQKRIFDKKKAILMLNKDMGWQDARQRDMENIKKLKDALKDFKPEFKPKGGS